MRVGRFGLKCIWLLNWLTVVVDRCIGAEVSQGPVVSVASLLNKTLVYGIILFVEDMA